jgi:hypothetical protein
MSNTKKPEHIDVVEWGPLTGSYEPILITPAASIYQASRQRTTFYLSVQHSDVSRTWVIDVVAERIAVINGHIVYGAPVAMPAGPGGSNTHQEKSVPAGTTVSFQFTVDGTPMTQNETIAFIVRAKADPQHPAYLATVLVKKPLAILRSAKKGE